MYSFNSAAITLLGSPFLIIFNNHFSYHSETEKNKNGCFVVYPMGTVCVWLSPKKLADFSYCILRKTPTIKNITFFAKLLRAAHAQRRSQGS